MTTEDKARLEGVLKLFLVTSDSFLGRTAVLEHDIELVDDAKPFFVRPHLFSPAMEARISREVDNMLKKDVIMPSKSPVASPVVPVVKKDGSTRLCLDSRKLNSLTVKDRYPVPNVEHTIARIPEGGYLSSLDLSSAFWQVPLSNKKKPGAIASAQELTAFVVPGRGLFQFKVMPFGLCNSPATQCRLMNMVLGNDLEPNVFCYVDDIVIVTKTVEHMLELVAEVGRRLRNANLSVNLAKCQFFAKELKVLGYTLSAQGLQTDPERLKCMREFPAPKNLRELRRFLGMTGYYRRLIQDYSGKAVPLTNLLKKNVGKFQWSPEAEKAFQDLKAALCTAPVVRSPDFSKEFILQCDASDISAAAALGQIIDSKEVVVAYYSHKWSPTEANWGATEREGACVLFAIKHFRGYLWGQHFTVVTDAQALTHLQTVKTDGSSRLARWALQLAQYDMTIKHRAGRLSVVPDALSRAIATIDVEPIQDDGDEWYQDMRMKLLTQPENYTEFRLEGSLLLKFESCQDNVGCFSYRWKRYVPSNQRLELIDQVHRQLCHLGWKKCFTSMRSNYFWPRMASEVEKRIRECPVCKASKNQTRPVKALMGDSRNANIPFRMIALDHWGPVTRSYRNNAYLLVVVDICTKYVLLHPCRDPRGKGVVKFLEEEVFLRFGVAEVVITDNFRALVGRDMVQFLNRYGTEHWTIAYYHSQGNPAKRYIRTVSTAIRCYVNEQGGDHKRWDENIAWIQMALNSTVHDGTRMSPFTINHGREMILSGDEYQFTAGGPERQSMSESQIRNKFDEIREKIQQNIQEAQHKNRQRYNERARLTRFSPGEKVWRRNRALSNAAEHFSYKLAPKYIACRIVKSVGRDTYEVQDTPSGPVLKYHANDLFHDSQ